MTENNALVFVKPHATTDSVYALVEKIFKDHKIVVVQDGEIASEKIEEQGIIDKHYATIAHFAMKCDPKKMELSEEAKEKFARAFEKSWDDAVKDDEVCTATMFKDILGEEATPADVKEKWNDAPERVKLAPGCYAAKVKTAKDDETKIIFNGFYLMNRGAFVAKDKKVKWYTVRWNEEDLTWDDFRQKVVGPTNPESAPEDSARGMIFKEWKSLGLQSEPNVSENGIHASASPLEAFVERNAWLSTSSDADPLGQLATDACGTEGAELLAKWSSNPSEKDSNAREMPVFDIVEEWQTTKFLNFMRQKLGKEVPVPPSEGSPKDTGRSKSAPTAFEKVLEEEGPEEDGKVYEDTSFKKKHEEIADEWRRITDVYPRADDDDSLVPETIGFEDVEQGLHPDCFFITALSVVCRQRSIIDNLFVSKKVRKDGKYTFQFFRWNKWVKVVVDDLIPCHDGKPIFARSPCKRWWPLLLEKAYAKFYTSFENINGGNLAEALHDMCAKPVTNVVFDSKYTNNTSNANINDVEFWQMLGESIALGEVCVSAGTHKELKVDFGLQKGHAYGMVGVVSMEDKPASLEHLLVRLVNPFKKQEYTGPMCGSDKKWTDALLAKTKYDKSKHSIFFIPVPEFIKCFAGLQMCHIEAYEDFPTQFDDEWTAETAGGNPTLTSWRKNPIFICHNKSDKPIVAMVTLKQPDQRETIMDTKDQTFHYLQGGLTLAVRTSAEEEKQGIPTTLLTGNSFKNVHKGIFFNQREVSNAIEFPPKARSYLVPSTFNPKEESKYMLSVYLPKGLKDGELAIEKAQPMVDMQKPLEVKGIKLAEKAKAKVEFSIENPSEIHVLVRQSKAKKTPSGGDTITDDYLACVLYKEGAEKIGGMSAAMNYRELSIIQKEVEPGTYTAAVTCVKSSDTAQFSIDIFTKKSSHAVIVSKPEGPSTPPPKGSSKGFGGARAVADMYGDIEKGNVPAPGGKKAPAPAPKKSNPAPPKAPAPAGDKASPSRKASMKAPAGKKSFAKAPAPGAKKATPKPSK